MAHASTNPARNRSRALLNRITRSRRQALPANSVFANDSLTRLRRFEPFAQMDWYTLSSYARHARVVQLPARRWITRWPRRLAGVWYLAAGVVQDKDSGLLLRAASGRCRHPVYPGAANLWTITAVTLLHIGEDDISSLGGSDPGRPPSNVPGERPVHGHRGDMGPGWLETLAASPVLRVLYQRRGAQGWQGWLRALDYVAVPQQKTLIQPGTVGDCFYIVAQGRAAVASATGERLCCVTPGGFFGEDALLTGQPRNATVTVSAGGQLLRGDYDQLAQLVDDLWWGLLHGWLGRFEGVERRSPDQRFLNVSSDLCTQELRRLLSGLPRDVRFQMPVGEHAAVLDLLLLLLTHRGFMLER